MILSITVIDKENRKCWGTDIRVSPEDFKQPQELFDQRIISTLSRHIREQVANEYNTPNLDSILKNPKE